MMEIDAAMVHWPVHPLLIVLMAAVFGLVSLFTRSVGVAGAATAVVWIAGMVVVQRNRLKPPKVSDPHRCSQCDYDLRGLPLHEHRCPECGTKRRYH